MRLESALRRVLAQSSAPELQDGMMLARALPLAPALERLPESLALC
jgi:chemotaxis protein histidine kinase CheA